MQRLVGNNCTILVDKLEFEPCGLTQLYALRYGSLPVVRRTGGLCFCEGEATDADGRTVATAMATYRYA